MTTKKDVIQRAEFIGKSFAEALEDLSQQIDREILSLTEDFVASFISEFNEKPMVFCRMDAYDHLLLSLFHHLLERRAEKIDSL